jgi:hypothetical protein
MGMYWFLLAAIPLLDCIVAFLGGNVKREGQTRQEGKQASGRYLKEKSGIYPMVGESALGTLLAGE